MLDYKFIKDNLDAVKQNIINRNMTADADKVVELFDKRTALVTKLQGLQQKRNENAQAMKQKLDNDKRQELIAAGKAIKDEISAVEAETKETEAALEEAARQIPNMVHPDAPIGKLDTENLEVKKVGTPRKFDFEPKDHVQLGESLISLPSAKAVSAATTSGSPCVTMPLSLSSTPSTLVRESILLATRCSPFSRRVRRLP